jgi:acyl carrier protein
MEREMRSVVRSFICDNFVVEDADFSDDDSFLKKSILDSTGILELVSFLEATFDIRVEDEDVTPANLNSVNKVCGFMTRKFEAVKVAHVLAKH